MDLSGRLCEVSRDYKTKKPVIKFVINEEPNGIEDLAEKDLRIKVNKITKPRSLDANAYYYHLVGQLANVLKASKPYIHNLMLRKYGQLQIIDDRPVWVILPDTDEVFKQTEENELLHLKPTAETKTGKDGTDYRTYLLLKGSHELDSKAFSILLDGIISECKEVGIQTETPEEIARMKALMEEKHGRGMESNT